MKHLKFEDLDYKAQQTIIDALDKLNASGERHKTIIEKTLNLKTKSETQSPLKTQSHGLTVTKAIFELTEKDDGSKSYIFKHAERP